MIHIWLMLFSAIGFGVSSYVWNRVKRKHKKLVCLQDENCNLVVTSPYAKIFGIDNSILGMLYYATIFIIGLSYFFFPELLSLNYVVYGLVAITGGSVLFTIYLTSIEIFVLKKICEYCTISGVMSVAIFVSILMKFVF